MIKFDMKYKILVILVIFILVFTSCTSTRKNGETATLETLNMSEENVLTEIDVGSEIFIEQDEEKSESIKNESTTNQIANSVLYEEPIRKYLEKIQNIVPEAKNFTINDLVITQIESSEFFLIRSPGSGGPEYCLYNEIEDKIIRFNIESTTYPVFEEGEIFDNKDSEEGLMVAPTLIGMLQAEDIYFSNSTHSEICMLATGERFWVYPWNFPMIIKYNVDDNTFRTERVKLNMNYTDIPGIEIPYLYLGYHSSNLSEICSSIKDNRITIEFNIVEENNNDDKSPAIFYYFDAEKNIASMLYINAILKEDNTLQKDFNSIEGISGAVITTQELSSIDQGFADFIIQQSPNGLTFDSFYGDKKEVQCVSISFCIDENVNFYGQMIDGVSTGHEKCSMQLYTTKNK